MKQQPSFTSVLPDTYLTNGRIDELNRRFEGEHPDRILQWSFETFGSDVVLGTGFGPSGVYLIHRIHKLGLGIPIFYLDTRLLFEETYQLRDTLEEQLGISITRVSPELTLEEQTDQFGDKLWNKDPDQCCHIRKVAPLRKHLADKKGWITGIRRDQSATRKNARILEYDRINDVIKLNPLAEWKNDDIWDYIHENNLPYNPLHDDGYPSIGCIPCTSPAVNGDERNGRWQGVEKTECGIHFPTLEEKAESNSQK